MPNTAASQQALATDPRFLLRVRNALASIAFQVLSEDIATPGHQARAQYARLVLSNVPVYAAQLAIGLVTRPNVMNFTTSYDFIAGGVVSTTGDADLLSQIATDWNLFAGV